MDEKPEKLLVAAEEASHLLSVSIKTLDAWRSKGKGPPFIRLTERGRGVRYKLGDLKRWIAERE